MKSSDRMLSIGKVVFLASLSVLAFSLNMEVFTKKGNLTDGSGSREKGLRVVTPVLGEDGGCGGGFPPEICCVFDGTCTSSDCATWANA